MNISQKIIVFYFSGTGNARQIALWLSEFTASKDIRCQIYDIAEINIRTLGAISDNTAIGFISPVHGFNYPKIMLDFIRRFPKGNGKVFLMSTRGGFKIGKHVTPGLTGISFMLSSLILKRKGYKVIGQIPFDMPSNWISLHPALNKRTVGFIDEKNYVRVKAHFSKLCHRGRNFASNKDIVQDLLISPIALGYYIAGRYFIAFNIFCLGTNS